VTVSSRSQLFREGRLRVLHFFKQVKICGKLELVCSETY
jgi:hypothetical protein